MTITQLGTFLKIAETRSFTSAAALLGYAQSTVTTQIKQLEEELGCLLFDRLGKNVILTPEGEKLSAYAEKILQFIMHDTFPDQLKKGSLDIAWSLNPAMDYPDLALLYDRPETLGFYAAPDHPLAGKKQVTEKDLAQVPLLLTSHTCSFRRMLLEDLERASVPPKIALETSSKEILRQFAANGLGVAFMPDMTAQEETGRGRLKRLDWAGNDFPVFSRVFVHRDKHLSPAIRGLAEIISRRSE